MRNGTKSLIESARECGVPSEIKGPGTIDLRQTTYWDVRSEMNASYRIHFRDQVELAFAGAAYAGIEISEHHPLLIEYDMPGRSLYFSGTPLRPRAVADQVERALRADSASWRGVRDYVGSKEAVERKLRAGHGMLMEASELACAVAARVLEAEGISCSILGNAPARPGKRVLLLGRSYIVAGRFAFEDRS